MKKQHIIIVWCLALIIGFGGAYGGVKLASDNGKNATEMEKDNDAASAIADKDTNGKEPEDMDKIVQAFHLIQDNYLEGADDDQLIDGAIKGMVGSLDDPFSEYMDADSQGELDQSIESSFEGIGAEVSMVDDQVTIISPIKDSPAEKEGLRPDDQIKRIDGDSTSDLDLNEAVDKIRGKKGSEVDIEVERAGSSDVLDFTLTRDEIPVETVNADTKDVDGKKTGVLEITSFAENTAKEFKTELEDLEDDGIEGLIIDVRGNPGGLLDSVQDLLSELVPKDTPYMQIEDPDGNKEPFYSNLKEKKDYPIDVLTDEGSASASEILAVALKEMGYDTVGQTSFGKGTVQNAVPMDDSDDTIKLTSFKWLSPDGEWIHEEGVEPTIEAEQPDYYYANPVQMDDETFSTDDADEKIENLQIMLDGLGYDPGRTDGYFSEKTEGAVKAFQEEQDDLEVDGVVDDETAGMLETNVTENVRDKKDDNQMEKALDSIYEQ